MHLGCSCATYSSRNFSQNQLLFSSNREAFAHKAGEAWSTNLPGPFLTLKSSFSSWKPAALNGILLPSGRHQHLQRASLPDVLPCGVAAGGRGSREDGRPGAGPPHGRTLGLEPRRAPRAAAAVGFCGRAAAVAAVPRRLPTPGTLPLWQAALCTKPSKLMGGCRSGRRACVGAAARDDAAPASKIHQGSTGQLPE